MPPRRTRRTRRTRRKRYARRNPRVTRSLMFNPQPVFTETVYAGTISPNTGGILKVNISNIPQIAQYSNLYQKYRIKGCSWILLPQYQGSDINSASYNASSGVFAWGMGRFVHAIDDSPAQVPPASEAVVLQHNGCKIKSVTERGLRMRNRPVANTLDSVGNIFTIKGKYLQFKDTNIDHFGITYWYSQPNLGTTSLTNNELHIYVKVTFQLCDPR